MCRSMLVPAVLYPVAQAKFWSLDTCWNLLIRARFLIVSHLPIQGCLMNFAWKLVISTWLSLYVHRSLLFTTMLIPLFWWCWVLRSMMIWSWWFSYSKWVSHPAQVRIHQCWSSACRQVSEAAGGGPSLWGMYPRNIQNLSGCFWNGWTRYYENNKTILGFWCIFNWPHVSYGSCCVVWSAMNRIAQGCCWWSLLSWKQSLILLSGAYRLTKVVIWCKDKHSVRRIQSHAPTVFVSHTFRSTEKWTRDIFVVSPRYLRSPIAGGHVLWHLNFCQILHVNLQHASYIKHVRRFACYVTHIFVKDLHCLSVRMSETQCKLLLYGSGQKVRRSNSSNFLRNHAIQSPVCAWPLPCCCMSLCTTKYPLFAIP